MKLFDCVSFAGFWREAATPLVNCKCVGGSVRANFYAALLLNDQECFNTYPLTITIKNNDVFANKR